MNIQRLIKVTKMHFVDEIYSRVDNMLFRGDEMHFVVTKIEFRARNVILYHEIRKSQTACHSNLNIMVD